MSERFPWSVAISGCALLGTVANAAASWSTWISSGEQMVIEVHRTLKAPINRVPFIGGVAGGIRTDGSLAALWDIYVINTSRTTILPLTDFSLYDWQYNGGALTAVSDDLAPHPGLSVLDLQTGKPLLLPVAIAPGSIRHLQVRAGFNVSLRAFPTSLPDGIPGTSDGGIYYSVRGVNGLDLFGNTDGDDDPGVLDTTDRKPRSPCLAIAFRSALGTIFHGQGHFYPEEVIGNSIYPQRACGDAQIQRPWQSRAPALTRLLMHPVLVSWIERTACGLCAVLLLFRSLLRLSRH